MIAGIDGHELVLRANPRYELVPLHELGDDDREALVGIAADPDVYGILRDPEAVLPIKLLNRGAAVLFRTLSDPAPVPAYVVDSLGPAAAGFVERCVLDGVLEARAAGAWVSGPGAARAAPVGEAARGVCADLSRRALEYAAVLPSDDAVTLSARLYFYNRLPATRRWRESIPDERAAARYLRIDALAGRAPGWREVDPPADNAGWHYFAPATSMRSRSGPVYKLYVSPLPHELPDVLEESLAALDGIALSAKVGRGLPGMLRPDKLVAYFDGRKSLEEGARRVRPAVAGASSHGVPFSAGWEADDGLLSWGVDPPADDRVARWQGASWRRWLTDRLASALASATRSGLADPAAYALERVALDGVDTATWAPAEDAA